MLFLALCFFMAYAGYKGWGWTTPVYATLCAAPLAAIHYYLVRDWNALAGIYRSPAPDEFVADVAVNLVVTLAVWATVFGVAKMIGLWRHSWRANSP